MIKNKNDLKRCLAMDKYALGINRKNPRLLGDEIWKFQITLRKHEYYHNCKHHSLINKFMLCYYKFKHHILGIKLGFSIPINVFDGGLKINHYGYIVVNPNAKIGCYCDIHQGVNIGTQGGGGPIIGDNVWIGPGAKLFGPIVIADNCQIGANAVVNKSFEEKGISIAGVPAKKISNHPNPYKRNFLLD